MIHLTQALTPDDLPRIAEAENAMAESFEHTIHVCVAAGCLSQHSDHVKQHLEQQVKAHHLTHCRVKGSAVRDSVVPDHWCPCAPRKHSINRPRRMTPLPLSRAWAVHQSPASPVQPIGPSSHSRPKSCWQTLARSIPSDWKITLPSAGISNSPMC